MKRGSASAAHFTNEQSQLEEALNTPGASDSSPLVKASSLSARKAEANAEQHLASALQALRVVPVLDRQDEAGRQALGRGLGAAVLDEGMNDEVVEAAVS